MPVVVETVAWNAERLHWGRGVRLVAHIWHSCLVVVVVVILQQSLQFPPSLHAPLLEIHYFGRFEVPREEKGKVKAVESEKGVTGVLYRVRPVRRWHVPLATNSDWHSLPIAQLNSFEHGRRTT